jgi:hypothetical protein
MIKRISQFTRYRSSASDMHPPAAVSHGTPIANTLHLPGVTLSQTALTLPTELTIEQWGIIGTQLAKFGNGIQWWLGDWWHYGDHHYGDRAKAVAKGIFPYEFETSANFGWVAGKVPSSLRNELLSFNHHYTIASLDDRAVQKKWLDKAAQFKWSIKKLRQKIGEQNDDENLSEDERAREAAKGYSERLEEFSEQTKARLAPFGIELAEQELPLILCWLTAEGIEGLAEKVSEAVTVWNRTLKAIRDFQANPKDPPQLPKVTCYPASDEDGERVWFDSKGKEKKLQEGDICTEGHRCPPTYKVYRGGKWCKWDFVNEEEPNKRTRDRHLKECPRKILHGGNGPKKMQST